MRPVNLLPARYRPRSGKDGDSKSSYVALGALALLVLAIFGYVMTANKVNSRNAEIAAARQQIAAAEAQAVTLKGFGDFAGVKESRLAAVRELATDRLDWERLFRELAHVLPEGVWLTRFSGTTASADGGAENASSVTLTGCAASHTQIADVMVRLRQLHIAEDVVLKKTTASEQTEDAAGATGLAAPAGAPAAGAGGDQAGCGASYSFDIDVSVAAATPVPADGVAPVPARLGGGE
jgi:Tfp pilus assembly protein PilN